MHSKHTTLCVFTLDKYDDDDDDDNKDDDDDNDDDDDIFLRRSGLLKVNAHYTQTVAARVRYLEGARDLSSTSPFRAQVPYCATLKGGGTTSFDLN